jgi:hypothetical protein
MITAASHPPLGNVVTDWLTARLAAGCAARGGDFQPDTLGCTCRYGVYTDGTRCTTAVEHAMDVVRDEATSCNDAGGTWVDGQCYTDEATLSLAPEPGGPSQTPAAQTQAEAPVSPSHVGVAIAVAVGAVLLGLLVIA